MERESRPSSWVLARHFADADRARDAYEAARDLLLEEVIEASAFRVTVDQVSFVALLGERPLGARETGQILHALELGRDAILPPVVVQHLREKRDQFRASGLDFIERRHGERG